MTPFSKTPYILCHLVVTSVIIMRDDAYKYMGLFFPVAVQNVHQIHVTNTNFVAVEFYCAIYKACKTVNRRS